MPQQQSNVTLSSPGFAGLNTEDSPLSLDPSFASVANNCTIDKLGRLSSRKGFKILTANPAVLGTSFVSAMAEFIKEDTGVSTLFVTGNNLSLIHISEPTRPY